LQIHAGGWILVVRITGRRNPKVKPLMYIVWLSIMLASVKPAGARVPEPYSLESVQLQPSAKLPKTLAAGVDASGSLIYTFENGIRMNVCEIFWAKALAEQEIGAGSSKLIYGNLKPGSFVGIIHFMPEADQEYRKDFKEQKLKAGYYTMRYGALPVGSGDSAQLGDFLILVPAALDRDFARTLPRNEILRLSHVASRTKEPAVMSLMEVTAARKAFPDVITDYAGTCVLQVKLHLKPRKNGAATDMALALVVLTPLGEGEGS
jgi:hypothetical protein